MRRRVIIAIFAVVILGGAAFLGFDLTRSNGPSAKAKMVCSDEAKEDIDKALGEVSTTGAHHMSAHMAACMLAYKSGDVSMTVEDFPSTTAAQSQVSVLANKIAAKTTLKLGDSGFQSNNTTVMQKDKQVLTVTTTRSPGSSPTSSPTTIGATTVTTILECWK